MSTMTETVSVTATERFADTVSATSKITGKSMQKLSRTLSLWTNIPLAVSNSLARMGSPQMNLAEGAY